MITVNRPLRRTLGAAALATVATCAALLPATAQAATPRLPAAGAVRPADANGVTNSSAPLFYNATPSDGWAVTLSANSTIDLHCWVDGASYNGTNRWFQVNYFGAHYYVIANEIKTPQPVLPSC